MRGLMATHAAERGSRLEKEDPREQGEIPRKRDDSEDHQQDPYHPAPGQR
ncbi:hypothetical protein SAN18_06420 [Raoultella planticola]|nr:hypothetical protein [Raoultella planticola]MDW4553017.1 hypothetical protein [Raoultella planticola]MDZ7504639.1 hypothetical protein [Raoultella planticola]MEA5394198.1 hypothetical protein [Raoultella planticola]